MIESGPARRITQCAAAIMIGIVAQWLASPLAARDSPVFNVHIGTPREFGYVIGDQIRHELTFDLASTHRFNPESLPKKARLTRWISLVEAQVKIAIPWPLSARRHRITLVYQIVNAPRKVLGVGIPPQSFDVIGPDGSLPIVIPAWGFTLSPLIAPAERAPGALPDLRPARLPPLFDTDARVIRIIVALTLGATMVCLLAYVHWVIPFVARTHGPFATAYRNVQRLRRSQSVDATLRAALEEVHHAFNCTAGHVVFAHDLDRFFKAHRRFQPLRDDIEQMFKASSAEFYRTANDAPCTGIDHSALIRLCLACRNKERGLA